MNVEYINPVLESMVNVLSTMARMAPQPGKPLLKTDKLARGDVTGIIDMSGADEKGSLAVSFPAPVIIEIARSMLNQEFTQVDDMVIDLAGEITNMVTGGAKLKLEEAGHSIDMSLPEIIVGKDKPIQHKYEGPTILLPFSVKSGIFFIEICFAPKAKK